jgi:hypothetical protein
MENIMGVVLAHGNVEWIVGGLVVFIGLMVLLVKIARGKILSAVMGLSVWYLVFSIHNMSTAGIMTATVAALLFDLFGIPMLRAFRKR